MGSSLRNWVVSSLSAGYKPKQLKEALTKSGFPPAEIEKELADAAPYILSLHTLKKKLKAREGLLKTLDYQLRALPHYLAVKKIPLPPFGEFLKNYYYPNQFGVFCNVLDNCEARHWTPRNLAEKAGADTLVQIQHGRDSGAWHEKNTTRFNKQIRFGDFIDLVENTKSSNDFYMTGANYDFNHVALKMLQKDIEDLGDGYLAPETPERRLDIFIGPKGTLTQAHIDVVNILYVQVYGKKVVRLVPSMQAPYMYNTAGKYSEVDLLNPRLESYPEFAKATVIEIEIGPGDCVFIPAQWWHHVVGLTPSISVACCNIKVQDVQK